MQRGDLTTETERLRVHMAQKGQDRCLVALVALGFGLDIL